MRVYDNEYISARRGKALSRPQRPCWSAQLVARSSILIDETNGRRRNYFFDNISQETLLSCAGGFLIIGRLSSSSCSCIVQPSVSKKDLKDDLAASLKGQRFSLLLRQFVVATDSCV
jgi:hypothetical protein